MSSGVNPATIGSMLLGTAAVTRPAPARKAPILAIAAAPLFPTEPAMINTCPKSPLCAFTLRFLNIATREPHHSSPDRDSIACGGEPIGATTIGPLVSRESRCAGFGAVKVTMALLRQICG